MIAVALLVVSPPAIGASLLVDDDFTGYTAAGLEPGGAGGALDSSLWAVTGASDGDTTFDASHPDGDFARGAASGGVRTGGLYAFLLPGGEAGLGVQATSSDFNPGGVIRRVVNDTGKAVSDLAVALDLWFLNNGARATRMGLDYRTPQSAAWVAVPGSERLTPAGADTLDWQRAAVAATLPLDVLAPQQRLLLRWRFEDAAGTGSRDEIALSGLRLSGTPSVDGGPPLPLPLPRLTTALALAGGVVVATRRRRRATGPCRRKPRRKLASRREHPFTVGSGVNVAQSARRRTPGCATV